MANVRLEWQSLEFHADQITSWRAFKKAVPAENHDTLLSSNAVYVIRITRPYSIQYKAGHSPVVYIGRGNLKSRIRNHLTTWIPELARKLTDARFSIHFCEPRARRVDAFCHHVESDLVDRFKARYEELPMRNVNTPSEYGDHVYRADDLRVLHPGRGKGYHWAIRPLPSSQFFKAA